MQKTSYKVVSVGTFRPIKRALAAQSYLERNGIMSEIQDRWVARYKEKSALWLHDGNPKRPHALLTSGKHSSGFFNSGLVTEDPQMLAEACHDLAVLARTYFNLAAIHRVIGPEKGAITMAHCVAWSINRLSARNSLIRCLSAFTEKVTVDGKDAMTLKRTSLFPGELVLPVEDVLTTGGSVERNIAAVVAAGGAVTPFIAVIVNRSGLTEVSGKKIVALIDKAMPMWTPEECPLCKEGSNAIRPKEAANWTALNADY